MQNALTRKLETFALLDDDDKRLLDDIVRTSRIVDAGQVIIHEGDKPIDLHLVVEGFAYRYKQLAEGNRQIVAYMIPGDFCDMHVPLLEHMDQTIAALSRCRIVDIPRHRVMEMSGHPAVQRALWWASLVDEAVRREWLVNMGGRSPEKRVAHFFCEMIARLSAVGLGSGTTCYLPLTQAHLGETLGLSTVHINRTLQGLSAKGLVDKKPKMLATLDFARLAAFADFDPNYLHLHNARGSDPVTIAEGAASHPLYGQANRYRVPPATTVPSASAGGD